MILTSCFKSINITDCGTSPNVTNSQKKVVSTITLKDGSVLESVVQYTCDKDYITTPPTADGTYTCVNGGNFTYTEFKCLKGFKFKIFLKSLKF